MIRAAFLDRDGVINRKAPEGQYITRWEDLEILPGVNDAISLLNRAGFLVVMVTNQRCIAKGLLTVPALESIHQRLIDQLGTAGGIIDRIYYCPHDMADLCECRKPKPGMLLQAAEKDDIDLRTSWIIGDSESDVKAGQLVGCSTGRVLNGVEKSDAELVGDSLLAVSRLIVSREQLSTEAQAQSCSNQQ